MGVLQIGDKVRVNEKIFFDYYQIELCDLPQYKGEFTLVDSDDNLAIINCEEFTDTIFIGCLELVTNYREKAKPTPSFSIWPEDKKILEEEKDYFIHNTPGMYQTYNGPRIGWSREKKKEKEN